MKIHNQWAAYLGRAEQGPNAKINFSFLIVTYSGPLLSFNHLYLSYSCFRANCYSSPYTLCSCWVTVCNWHSLNTYYYRTTFSGVPGSFNSDRIECMCSQNRPRFKVPSEQLSNEVQVPCLRGLRNDQQKSCFSAITNFASTVSLAPTWLPWPPCHLSEGCDSCTRSCWQGSNWVPSDYQSDALSTWQSVPICLPTEQQVLLFSPLLISIDQISYTNIKTTHIYISKFFFG